MVRDGAPLAADEPARILQALLRSTTALLDDDPAQALLARCCQALCDELPWLRLVWAWYGPLAADTVQPQVLDGPARDAASGLRITGHLPPGDDKATPVARLPDPNGVDPVLLARTGQPVLVGHTAGWASLQSGHVAALPAGTRALLALPLGAMPDPADVVASPLRTSPGLESTVVPGSAGTTHSGALVLYADDEHAFDRPGLRAVLDTLVGLFSAVLARAADPSPAPRPADGPTDHPDPAATRDSLTGLPGRTALASLVARMRRPRLADPPASLVLLNLDHFKRLNDAHGRAAGDEWLRQVAQLLRGAVRQGDCCLRWSGDGFLLALPGASGAQARLVVEKLRQRLRGLPVVLPDGPAPTVTASFGVADLQPGETLDHAVARAEAALTAAKRGGRNRVVVD